MSQQKEKFDAMISSVKMEIRRAHSDGTEQPDEDKLAERALREHPHVFENASFALAQVEKFADSNRPVYAGKFPADKEIFEQMTIGQLTRTMDDLKEHYDITKAFIEHQTALKNYELTQSSTEIIRTAVAMSSIRKRKRSITKSSSEGDNSSAAKPAGGGSGKGILAFLGLSSATEK